MNQNLLERLVGIKSGQTTSDMKFSLDYSRCVGVCREPPIITVNGRVYESVTPEDIPSILKNYK
ncbi:MAG: NAD(P)H-dependent oxidoreductase subunit E [Terrisporobacter sp.]